MLVGLFLDQFFKLKIKITLTYLWVYMNAYGHAQHGTHGGISLELFDLE